MKKKIITLLSFALLVIFSAFVLTGCSNIEENSNSKLFATEVVSNGVELKMSRMSNSTNEMLEITAEVVPSNASDKTLNWELAWSSSFTQPVTNYVSMKTSNDTLTCTLSLIQRFSTPITVTVTSNSNSEVSASCNLKCYKLTDAIDGFLNISLDGNSNIDLEYEGEGIIYINNLTYDNIFNSKLVELNSFSVSPHHTVGTDSVTTEYKCQIALSAELQDLLEARGINYSGSSVDFVTNRVDGYISQFISDYSTNEEGVLEVLNTTSNWFTIYVICEDYVDSTLVNEYAEVVELKGFSVADYYENQSVAVTNIKLVDENVYF